MDLYILKLKEVKYHKPFRYSVSKSHKITKHTFESIHIITSNIFNPVLNLHRTNSNENPSLLNTAVITFNIYYTLNSKCLGRYRVEIYICKNTDCV